MKSASRIVMVGPFGLRPRMTMRVRALPLARALVRRGHNVTLLLPPWQNPEDAGRSWVDAGVTIENVDLPRGLPGWFHWRLSARLVRRVRAIAPDVVHTFKPKAYAGLAHLGLARRYPVVVDTDDWEGPGGWNVQGDYPRWMQRFFAWQERWGLAHADAVTVASRALQTLVWATGRAAESVFYLPNGSDGPVSAADPRGSARPTVLLYTRFFEYSLDRLWRIMVIVHSRRPDARFVVVGKGFAGEEERLVQLARGAGWRVIVRDGERDGERDGDGEVGVADADLSYVGWGTEALLAACFAAADVGIYPFDDTLLNRTKCPVKLMDLLSAGLPVVADAVGQLREAIVDGETGYVVPPGDDAAFAEAVLRLLADPERAARMGTTARADIRDRYAWDRLAEVAEAAYRDAIRRRSHA